MHCPRAADLFPDWTEERRTAFYMEKEQRFRDMAGRVDWPPPALPEHISKSLASCSCMTFGSCACPAAVNMQSRPCWQ